MKLKGLFSRPPKGGLQTNGNPRPFAEQTDLDKKLVLSLSKSRIPNFRQLKYLPKFFSSNERNIIRLVFFVLFLALLLQGGVFYKNHVEYLPKSGGEYTEGLVGSIKFINPLFAQTNEVDRDISRLIFSSLLQYNHRQELVPDLAESYTVSEDKKNYTIYLKKGVKWHDGAALTVDDIVFTVQNIQDPEYKSPLSPSLRGVKVDKVDDYQIMFSLQEPYAPFLEILTFGILPKHIWNDIPANNAQLAEYNLKPVGSGPFKFESLIKDRSGNIKSYTLASNGDYYNDRPFINRIYFKFYSDFTSAVEALRNKNIEGISFLPNALRGVVAKNKNLNFYSLQIPQHTALFFNQTKKELLKEKQLRQALALGLDRDKILEETLGGEGLVIDSPILPGYLGYNPEVKRYNYNIEEANKTLDELKWEQYPIEKYIEDRLSEELKKLEEERQKQAEEQRREIDTEEIKSEEVGAEEVKAEEIPEADSGEELGEKSPEELIAEQINLEIDEGQRFFRKSGGEILILSLTTVSQAENIKAAELIKRYWQQLGIKVNLNIVSPADIRREVIKNRDYEILLYSEIIGSDPDPYPFWHSSQNIHPGLNLAIFVNRHIDELLEQARQTTDERERVEKYIKFQELLTAELPAIFLYSPSYTYAVDGKVKGIGAERLTVPSDRFANIEKWYIKTKKKFK